MALYVGTSGFAYKEWQAKPGNSEKSGKPDFYPADLPQKSFLQFYSNALDACEINATFYKVQETEIFTRWVESTREGFRFSIKAHRKLTHSKELALNEERSEFLQSFLRSMQPLGRRLAAILYQFPPTRTRDDAGLASLLDAHPRELPFACEFRHETWNDDAVKELIAERGGTVCVSDTTGDVLESLPSGRVGYLRMRSERYTEEQRAAWLALLTREAADRDLYAFTKHEGIPSGDPYGGIGLAQWLIAHRRPDLIDPIAESWSSPL